jgi:hypothetical protein
MIFMDTAGVRRIEDYFARIGVVLGSAKRRFRILAPDGCLTGGRVTSRSSPTRYSFTHAPRALLSTMASQSRSSRRPSAKVG